MDSANRDETAYLAHNDGAVLKHMDMYQGIITRMAQNSAAIKQWGLPLITVILAYVVKEKLYVLVWLSVWALLIFYLLDSYYLIVKTRLIINPRFKQFGFFPIPFFQGLHGC